MSNTVVAAGYIQSWIKHSSFLKEVQASAGRTPWRYKLKQYKILMQLTSRLSCSLLLVTATVHAYLSISGDLMGQPNKGDRLGC